MKEYKSDQVKNISVIGSSQIGKTTLGDAIIHSIKKTSRQGSVDNGTSVLDYNQDELERKITINSSLYTIEHNKSKLNFIDCPGYPAFCSQVVSAINVCESSLIVLGAVAGVEVLTKKIWKQSKAQKQSRFVFMNRMDREMVDFDKIVSQAQKILSSKIIPLFLPIGQGDNFKGIVDLISQKAFLQNNDQAQEIPEEMQITAEEARSKLLEAAAENKEELLEKYLETGALTDTELIEGLKLGINANDIIPLMVGSALKNIGILKLVEYLELLAPTPLEKGIPFTCEHHDEQTEFKQIKADSTPLIQLFKINEENKSGEVFYFKLFSGKILGSEEFTNFQTKQKERLNHIYTYCGKDKEELKALYAGDIGATVKLKNVNIGQTLYAGKEDIKIKEFEFPRTVISQAITTESEKDREKLGEGLHYLNKIDPCFSNEYRKEFNEVVVSGMSKLHIDIMLQKIKAKYKIELSLSQPKIPYRETITVNAKAQGKYKKQTGGHGQYGDCWLELMPKPVGSGYNFVNKIAGGVIPSKYIPAVEKGVKEAMQKGVLAGFPVVDIQVTLYDGSHHSVDSSDLAFQMAGILAFKNAAENAKMILLEPIMEVQVVIPEEYVGDITADFNQRRGKIMGMESTEDDYRIIKAQVPMADLYQYSIDLKSMTKGEGVYSKEFNRYEVVPSSIAQKVIEGQKVKA
jgi:elongation factor G